MQGNPAAYLPSDRVAALAAGRDLPDRCEGTVLFADIAGFTLLTESLHRSLGPRRGAEELTRRLDLAFAALCAEVDLRGGSILGFAGDAITCWFDSARLGGPRHAARAAVEGAEAMIEALRALGPSADGTPGLAVKAALASGSARRFVTGDPGFQILDLMGGPPFERVAEAEELLVAGEIVADGETLRILGAAYARTVVELRRHPDSTVAYPILGPRATFASLLAYLSGLGRSMGLGRSLGLGRARPSPRSLPGIKYHDNYDDDRAATPSEALRPWINPAIWKRETGGLGDFDAEFRPCAVLFVRFSGIDWDASGASGRLSACIRLLQATARRQEGDLLQVTIGDKGSYAYLAFGAIHAHEDDARRAARAALDILASERELGFAAGLRCGMSFGLLYVGTYGAPGRRAFSALGDDVNLAARLMQRAEAGTVLVSGRVLHALEGEFHFDAEQAVAVKGKSEPITVARLSGEQRRRTIRLEEPRYALPMAGRKEELRLAGAALEEALAGRCHLVSLVGEAGLGKSRLLVEIIRTARRQGFEGYAGACRSDSGDAPWHPWRPLFEAFFDLDPKAPAERSLAALAVWLETLAPSRLPSLPLLAAFLHVPAPDSEFTLQLDASRRRTALHQLLGDCVEARSRRSPLILALEDSHWIDQTSRELLDELRSRLVAARVLFVTASRPEDSPHGAIAKASGEGPGAMADKPSAAAEKLSEAAEKPSEAANKLSEAAEKSSARLVEIRLGDLSREDGVQAARSTWNQIFPGAGDPPEALLDAVLDRAQGNPFYIEELLRFLRDRAEPGQDPKDLEMSEIPDSLHALVLQRIDNLGERERVTLKVASVIGRVFPASWLPGYYPPVGSLDLVRGDLNSLERLDLTPLERPEPELAYLFKHMTTREVAYEGLTYELRARLHERLAVWLEAAYPESPPVEALAYHFGMGNDEAKKRHWYRRAAESAAAGYSNRSAIAWYTKLLALLGDLPESVVAFLARATLYDEVGDATACEADYRSALAGAERHGLAAESAMARRGLGILAAVAGNRDDALALLDQAAVELAGLGSESDAFGSRLDGAWVLMRSGEFPASIERLEGILADARARGLAKVEAKALHYLGTIAHARGEVGPARAWLEQSLEIKRSLGERLASGNTVNNLGVIALDQGDYAAAQTWFDDSLSIMREVGDAWGQACCVANLAAVALGRKEPALALRLAEESVAAVQGMNDPSTESTFLSTETDARVALGDRVGARRSISQALALQGKIEDPPGFVLVLVSVAGFLSSSGDHARATRLLAAIETLRSGIGFSFGVLNAATVTRVSEAALAALGPERVAAERSAGAVMDRAKALAEAQEGLGRP